MAVGGDIKEVTFNHPTVGNGRFFPKAGEDSTYDLGGYTSADDAQGIDGGGNAIDTLNRKRWSFEVVCAWDANNAQDLENAQALTNSPLPGTYTVTNINGTVYQCTGRPVGDIQGNGNAATFSLKISGGGVMEKIA